MKKNIQQAPAMTPESRENQLISLAIDVAEKKLRDGTASNQLICHYLKLGTTIARLEKEKLENENELLRARTGAIKSAETVEKLYKKAIDAMRIYGGQASSETYEDDDD